MKHHFKTLFDRSHRWWTAGFLIAAALLFAGAAIVGTTDNPPGLIMFTAGVMSLFLSIFHPWRKPSNYGILAGICAAIILAIYIGIHFWASFAIEPGQAHTPTKGEGIVEAILFITILFVCVPGILVGIGGAIFWGIRTMRDEGRGTKDERRESL
jgi:hypothetical protein